jgi:hypothetical protein
MHELFPSNPIAKLLAIPASVAVLCSLNFMPPPGPAPSRKAAVAAKSAAKKVARKPIPRLVAIDGRIARRVNALQPGVKRRLQQVVRRLPADVTLLVTSARRTREEQAALKSTFGVKARPGTSAHEDGRAIDLNVIVDGERISPRKQQHVIGAAMAKEGFVYLGRMDPVHYSIPKAGLKVASGKLPERGPAMEIPTVHEMRELIAEQNVPAPAFVAGEGNSRGFDTQ